MEHESSIKRNQDVEDKHLKMAVFNEPVILVNLGPHYQPSMSGPDLYEATKSVLRVSEDYAKKTRLVCASYQNFIKEVYTVTRWLKDGSWGKYIFEGQVADEELRARYIGRSVAAYWKRGSQDAIKYAAPGSDQEED